jgi:glycine hydroxymethyltransferase
MNVDVDKTIKLMEEHEPKMLILGASLFLFPHPIKELAATAKACNTLIVYDAAHVLGLIAGKHFQQPFKEGADIVTSSTHKTFPGPQGGVVMAKESVNFEAIQKGIFPKFVCNHHIHRIPALAQTTWEMSVYGESYARQVIRNAKTLTERLAELGFKVLAEDLGFTESHQVVIDVRNYGGGKINAEKLEVNNIIANKNMIPGDETSSETMKNPSGIRIGVQEMTRWGCKESDMEVIAEFIARCLMKNENVKDEVISFRKNFVEVQYC